MKNFKSDTNKLLIKFVVKSVISTILSVFLFTFIFSKVIYKFDIDIDYNSVFSIIIVAISSAIISYISVRSIKNNGVLMGIISIIPLVFYSLINLIINNNSFILFLVKVFIIVLSGALFGVLAVKKTNKFKVK